MLKKILLCSAIFNLFSLLSTGGILIPGEDALAGKSQAQTKARRGYEKMDQKKWLTEDQQEYLLKLVRQTIKDRLFKAKGSPGMVPENIPGAFKKRAGTFVTIKKEGNLRGCIGHIIPEETLIQGVLENAINAAFRDPRFPPLRKEEFPDIHIEISILTPPKELSYQDSQDLLKKLRPEIDGVILKKGFYQATFLPQVWEQLPDKKEFLSHLCMKAGLPADSWSKEKLQISTYQVQAFEEKSPEED